MTRASQPARVVLMAAVLAFTLGIAITATNVVPPSRAGSTFAGAPTANQLKPPQCAALDLEAVVVGNGAVDGTGAPDLILGGVGADTIAGRGGADCLVGGAGDDYLRGDGGRDVCFGGAGTDSFHTNCEARLQ
jgi:hypothetical protein